MKDFFNRKEIIGIFSILIFIFALSYLNYLNSLRRSRDIQRREDWKGSMATTISASIPRHRWTIK